MNKIDYKANKNHNLEIKTSFGNFLRIPIKTKVIHKGDSYEDLVDFAIPHLKDNDIIFISEKVISIIQDRVKNIKDIQPSKFASFLSKNVGQNPDSNLKDPYTMQLAIEEAGVIRIFIAAAIAAITKPFGVKGLFYIIAGPDVRAIDSPDEETLPPYDKFVSLAPSEPENVAKLVEKYTGHTTVIADANYKGVNILGISNKSITEEMCREIFIDNPLGQAREQTPIAIVRKIKD